MTKRFCDRCEKEIATPAGLVRVTASVSNKYDEFELCGDCFDYIKTELTTPPPQRPI